MDLVVAVVCYSPVSTSLPDDTQAGLQSLSRSRALPKCFLSQERLSPVYFAIQMWLVESPAQHWRSTKRSAMGICVAFAQLSPQGTRSRAPGAFATLLSTVCVTSGVPVITERSCSSMLFQVMRTEVSLPLRCQVTASPMRRSIHTIHQRFVFVQGIHGAGGS